MVTKSLGLKESKSTNLSVFSQACHNVKICDESLRSINYKLTQLNSIKFYSKISTIQTNSIQIFTHHFTPKVKIKSTPYTDNIKFIFLIHPNHYIISDDSLLDSNYIFGFDSHREFNIVVQENTKIGTMIVPRQVFQFYADQMQRDDLNSKFLEQNHIRILFDKMNKFRQYFQEIFSCFQTCSLSFNPSLSQNYLEKNLVSLLINSLQHSKNSHKPIRNFRRAEIVKAVENYMLAYIDSPLTLKDLCDAVGCSSRALSYGFKDLFGMSAMSYLKVHRLNGVYRALKEADLDDTVMRIASHWGFWSMGHFSRDYKQMFGESPSETLKQS